MSHRARSTTFGKTHRSYAVAAGLQKRTRAFVASMWRSTLALPFLTIYVCARAAMTVASKARFAVPSSFGGVGQQNVPQLRPLNILFLMADQMRFGKLFEKD